MYNSNFIVSRDGCQYSRKYYRLQGNMLQVKHTELEGTSTHKYPVIRWKDIRTIEL
jgi:hypothetical protein